jgi:hypothetical protein
MLNAFAGQPDMPQQMMIEPTQLQWYNNALIQAFLDLGWWGWAGLGCLFIGAITVACFFIGRGSKVFDKYIPVFSLIKRLFKTWRNLIRGE